MSDIHPYLVLDNTTAGRTLTHIPVKDRAFQEDWLQQLLFKQPGLLPVDVLDDSFAPLIPIGREIANIDNLFISPGGLLTIVETKLWRNQEAHRTVVAQILEYANTLTKWNYTKLNAAVKESLGKLTGKQTTIFESVKNSNHNLEIEEIEFQSRVQDGLSNGKFALLIVGDKIFPQATQLADTIQSAPHLQFSMGFVELRCYRLEKDTDWPMLIVPVFVARTTEFTRAVVRVIYEEKKPEVQITAIEEEKSTSKTNSSIFLASLPLNIRDSYNNYLNKWASLGYTIYWGTAGFSLRINWHGKLITIFEGYPKNFGIVTQNMSDKYGLPEGLYQKYKQVLLQSRSIGSFIVSGRRYINYADITDGDIISLLDNTDSLAGDLFNNK